MIDSDNRAEIFYWNRKFIEFRELWHKVMNNKNPNEEVTMKEEKFKRKLAI
jgi:hypothetical protein